MIPCCSAVSCCRCCYAATAAAAATAVTDTADADFCVLQVLGVSTSHCVYATCRDATESFKVIVRQASQEPLDFNNPFTLLLC